MTRSIDSLHKYPSEIFASFWGKKKKKTSLQVYTAMPQSLVAMPYKPTFNPILWMHSLNWDFFHLRWLQLVLSWNKHIQYTGSYDKFAFSFLRIYHNDFQWPYQLIIPETVNELSSFPTSLLAFAVSCFVDFSHSH